MTALIPLYAHASDWRIMVLTDNSLILADYSTLKKLKNNQIQVWINISFIKTSLNGGREMDKLITLELLSCDDKKYKALQSTLYYKDGTSTGQRGDDNWSYVIPDTNQDELFSKLCK
jgi:hypothetical protein